jgi:hypothetical protein
MGVVPAIMAATIAVFGSFERRRIGPSTTLNGVGMTAIAMPQIAIANMDCTPYVFELIMCRQAQ